MSERRNRDLEERRLRALEAGGKERVERQHASGKMTARERVEALLDEGSFEELGQLVTHRSRDFGMEKTSRKAVTSSRVTRPSAFAIFAPSPITAMAKATLRSGGARSRSKTSVSD